MFRSEFKQGVESKSDIPPESNLLDKKYTKNLTRSFKIVSRDLYSNIFVMEFENHVVVLLVDGRM